MNQTFKRTILANAIHGIIVSAAMMPVVAFAAEERALEEVVVTGSRISRPDLSSVSPYTIVSGEEFRISGNMNIEQKLNELPSVVPSFGAFHYFFSTPGGQMNHMHNP